MKAKSLKSRYKKVWFILKFLNNFFHAFPGFWEDQQSQECLRFVMHHFHLQQCLYMTFPFVSIWVSHFPLPTIVFGPLLNIGQPHLEIFNLIISGKTQSPYMIAFIVLGNQVLNMNFKCTQFNSPKRWHIKMVDFEKH